MPALKVGADCAEARGGFSGSAGIRLQTLELGKRVKDVVVAPGCFGHGVQCLLHGTRVERPAGRGAIGQKQVSRQPLDVIEVVDLLALLEALDNALEAHVDEVQVLQVADLGIEGEMVAGGRSVQSLGQRGRERGEGEFPIGGGGGWCRVAQ